MIDIHAHILPGVDDGPKTWDDALAILQTAYEGGITAIAATSHMLPVGPFANTRDRLLPLITELRERAAARQIAIEIYAGGEVHISPDLVQRYDAGQVLTYGDAGRFMLVELPPAEIPVYTEQVLFDLQLRGVTPIIAHVERNQGVMRRPDKLVELIQRGALAQVTASSLTTSGALADLTRSLIEHQLVHFIATDTHGVRRRRPELKPAVEQASAWIGEEAAQALVYENPRRMLAGEALHVPTPSLPVGLRSSGSGRARSQRSSGGLLRRLTGRRRTKRR